MRRVRRVSASPVGIVIEDVAPPPVAAGRIGIRSACSLISAGTELHYRDQAIKSATAMPLGYCNSGTVIELGEGVEGFAVGDRVTAMGWGYALHAEQIAVPYKLCVPVPDGVPFERAVFADLAATSLHAVHRGTLHRDDRVLVIGAGLVGLLLAQIAKPRVRHVVVADRLPSRVDIARRLGLDGVVVESDLAARVGDGIDAIFLCMQGEATELVRTCVEMLAQQPPSDRHRRMVAVGRFVANVEFSVAMSNIDIRYAARCGAGYRNDEFVHGRVDVPVPAGEQTVTANLAECVQLLAAGTIVTEPLVSHRVPFASAVDAYAALDRPDAALGVLLTYGDEDVTRSPTHR